MFRSSVEKLIYNINNFIYFTINLLCILRPTSKNWTENYKIPLDNFCQHFP